MLSQASLACPAAWLQEVLDESQGGIAITALGPHMVARKHNVDLDANIPISKLQDVKSLKHQ